MAKYIRSESDLNLDNTMNRIIKGLNNAMVDGIDTKHLDLDRVCVFNTMHTEYLTYNKDILESNDRFAELEYEEVATEDRCEFKIDYLYLIECASKQKYIEELSEMFEVIDNPYEVAVEIYRYFKGKPSMNFSMIESYNHDYDIRIIDKTSNKIIFFASIQKLQETRKIRSDITVDNHKQSQEDFETILGDLLRHIIESEIADLDQNKSKGKSKCNCECKDKKDSKSTSTNEENLVDFFDFLYNRIQKQPGNGKLDN